MPLNDRVSSRVSPGPGRRPARHLRTHEFGDVVFRVLCQAAGVAVLLLLLALVAILVWRAWESIQVNGVRFFTTATWDPEPTHRRFGALAFVYGTVVTSVIAMLVAVPLGVGTATFLSEIAPKWLRSPAAFLVEMLAAIPSVVYGYWGMSVFAPLMGTLIRAAGGPENAGIGLLSAGLVLGIMVVPYAAAVSFDVIRAVPRSQREGALALGATRWQTIWNVVLPFARPGIVGGCFLALGRALGETMAVTMLIGNRPDIVLSLFAKGNSIPSVIANEFTEATYDLYLSALVELGVVLLVVSVGFSVLGRLLTWRMSRRAGSGGGLRFGRLSAQRLPAGNQQSKPLPLDPSLRRVRDKPGFTFPRGGRRWSVWLSRMMTGGSPKEIRRGLLALAVCVVISAAIAWGLEAPQARWILLSVLGITASVVTVWTLGMLGLFWGIAVVPLFAVLGYLLYRGASSLSWDFFTHLPAPVGQPGGGMANAFYGSALMVGLATAFAVPVGVLAAIYLAEFRSDRIGPAIRFVGEMLASVPSIVIGIFGYYAVVRPITHNFSGLAGGFALGVMMLPIVMRASEEALKVVPKSIRHASLALGASQWQTIMKVTVPAALSAIITAVFLSVARVAGETAPLLLTASSNAFWPRSLNDYTPSLPVFIFNYAISPYEEWHQQAWAAAFVLVATIMAVNVGVRFLAGRRVALASSGE